VCVDDAQRRLAIVELLDRPDPPELRRGHRLRVEGKPERFVMLTRLSAMYVQARLLALEERRRAVDDKPTAPDTVRCARQHAREETLIAVPA
jgi:hypothetical protein